jgi:hypothetical protein
MKPQKPNDYVLLSDGLPLEVLDQILIELRDIHLRVKNLEGRLDTNLGVLEGAFVNHLEACHE